MKGGFVMEDQLIIELFFERSEDAIRELSLKYEKMCRRLANKFLHNEQDIEECINDVYLAIWNTIPPQKPNPLGAYICRIAKNVALKKYRTNTAQKRNHYYDVILEEVDEFLSVNETVESEILAKEISNRINIFIGQLRKKDRVMFVQRYWASCEDNGIRMEVEGISIQDNCAYVYISMQDLEGMRMDESIDLFDSYSIHTNADQIGGCTLVDFDEENQKSIFLITVQHMDGTSIEGSVMTFSVSQFLTGKNEIQAELTQISLDAISEVTETQKEEGLDIRGGSYTDGYVPTGMAGEHLYEDDSKLFVPTPGVTVTNYGFVNDKLHIQVYYEDILQFDNHGYVYLFDADGNDVLPECSTAFWDEEKQGSYEEYIFDVNAEALENYKIYGHFFTCQNLVEGDWEVRFTIKNQ